MAQINRIGFGQVEPNHLSAQKNGKIYAQLSLDESIEILENGQFMFYDYAAGKVAKTSENLTEPFLVFNEVKVYDERDSYKDFALKKTDFMGGVITPRLFKTDVGDIFTTNCFKKAATDKNGKTEVEDDLTVGSKLVVNNNGYLEKKDAPEEGKMVWQVVKVYTMPDGQPGVKIQRIA